MFGIGMPELLLILAVALIVIGPKKLPDLARSLGKAMGEFKRATNDLKESIEKDTGIDEVRKSLKDTQRDITNSLKSPPQKIPAVKPDSADKDVSSDPSGSKKAGEQAAQPSDPTLKSPEAAREATDKPKENGGAP